MTFNLYSAVGLHMNRYTLDEIFTFLIIYRLLTYEPLALYYAFMVHTELFKYLSLLFDNIYLKLIVTN